MATIAENLNIIESVKGEIKDILSLDNHLESYPNAIAEGLTDEAELQTISERTTADGASIKDSVAYVKSIHGNCVKWNQLVTNLPKTQTQNGVTFTNNGDGTITINGTATANAGNAFSVPNVPNLRNHKVIVLGVSGGTSLSYALEVAIASGSSYPLDVNVGNPKILSIPDVDVTRLVLIPRVWSGYSATNVVISPQIIDLTAMGWEDITSADAFAQRLGYDNASSLPYFAYDEGSIKTFNATKIVSKDSDGETIGELSTDIPSLFADGLCSAGTAYDEVTKNKAVKRIGKVDLGTLTWSKNSSQQRFYASVGEDIVNVENVNTKGNVICKPYATDTFANCQSHNGDKIVGTYNKYVTIYDSSLGDKTVAEFKSAMNGVYLYYELAEPTEQTLTERKSWYKVSANGKEQIVGTNSAPMKAEIGYRYDEDELEALASAAGI